jgi:hypothetical protein
LRHQGVCFDQTSLQNAYLKKMASTAETVRKVDRCSNTDATVVGSRPFFKLTISPLSLVVLMRQDRYNTQ